MSYLAQQGDGLEPTATFLDPLPLPLADAVAGMTRRPLVQGTAAPTVILCDMRRDLQIRITVSGIKKGNVTPRWGFEPQTRDSLASVFGQPPT